MKGEAAHRYAGSSSGDQQSAELLALAFLDDGRNIEDVLMRLRSEIAALDGWAPPSGDAGMLLATLAVARPAALGGDIGTALANVIRQGDLSRTWQPTVDEAFRLLALLVATPAHVVIPDLVQAVLLVPQLHPRWYGKAVELLQALSDWRPDMLDLATLLATAERVEGREASALFHTLLAPLLLADPAGIDLDTLRRACALPTDLYAARYLVATLAYHDGASNDVRAWARQVSVDWFPLGDAWRRLFRRQPLHVLCVQNISDGQGDEMIRTVPLLQALLDDQPETRVTLITDRAYLYGHPRIQTISFDERARIGAVLRQRFDGLIEFYEPCVPHLNHDTDLAAQLRNWRNAANLRFDFQSSKGWTQFTFDSVRLGGTEWAESFQFNRLLGNSVYDPVMRLIAELGLPLRIGEQSPRSAPVLIGRDWGAADAAWDETISGNITRRPLALLNPFGGNAALKGFVRQKFDDLAALVQSLIDDGYFVVICPNGTAWGSRDLIENLLNRLAGDVRGYVGIAPDPAISDLVETEDDLRRETARASETIRSFISFVSRADLIVTVEGWMMHAAYLLGRPYRLLLLPRSGDRSWQPWGRSQHQRVWLLHGDPALDHPPLPEPPRKAAWLALLNRVTDPAWSDRLSEIEQTADPDIRRAAVRALGRSGGSAIVHHLASLLADRSSMTRSGVAEALLNFQRDAVGRDGVPSAAILEAYRLIGATQFTDWGALMRQGPTALPALYAALHGDEPVYRREAAIVLERISRERGADAVKLTPV
ncbi:MAG TPA: HEAT repeat domain-containing protein [Nitrolancea sp.]|nr:HEAT repeat domain-containing protein [Nitrolancea sp.]